MSRFAPARLFRHGLLAAGLTAALAAPMSASATSEYLECRKAEAVQFPGTIVDAAVATPELSTLTQLVVAAGLADALSQPGHLTVFAPLNAAFEKIPADVLGAIGGNLDVLTAVLTYHVVDGRADPRAALSRKATTLQGQTLLLGFERGAGATVNQSIANCTAVHTTNGTVWLIDSVMLPQFR